MHKHTKKSCLKHGNGCRFDFPHPPSEKTMITRPINELYPGEDEKSQNKLLEEAKDMITTVKSAFSIRRIRR